MPKNAAPVAGSATATPSTALMAVTEVSFASVDASDKDGDTLTYSWDFGDSTTGSGPNVKHTYAAAGTYAATVTVSDGKKSATTTAPAVNVVSLNGNWSGTFGTSGVNRFAFTLTQTGTQLTGGFDMIWANTYCQTNGERLVSASVRTPQRMSLTVEVPTSCYGTYLGALTDHYECDLDSTFQVCTGVWTEDGFSTSYQFTMRK
jgi:PKD repeat protein